MGNESLKSVWYSTECFVLQRIIYFLFLTFQQLFSILFQNYLEMCLVALNTWEKIINFSACALLILNNLKHDEYKAIPVFPLFETFIVVSNNMYWPIMYKLAT